jgi:hypothetical protein
MSTFRWDSRLKENVNGNTLAKKIAGRTNAINTDRIILDPNTETNIPYRRLLAMYIPPRL